MYCIIGIVAICTSYISTKAITDHRHTIRRLLSHRQSQCIRRNWAEWAMFLRGPWNFTFDKNEYINLNMKWIETEKMKSSATVNGYDLTTTTTEYVLTFQSNMSLRSIDCCYQTARTLRDTFGVRCFNGNRWECRTFEILVGNRVNLISAIPNPVTIVESLESVAVACNCIWSWNQIYSTHIWLRTLH